jgi:hypothetical protein
MFQAICNFDIDFCDLFVICNLIIVNYHFLQKNTQPRFIGEY